MGESQGPPPETPASKPDHPVALNAPADLSNADNISQTIPSSISIHKLDFTAGYGSDNSAHSPLASTHAGSGVYKPLPRIPRAKISSTLSQPIIPLIKSDNVPKPHAVPHDSVRDNCIQDARATSSHQSQNSGFELTRNTNKASVHSNKDKETDISPFPSIESILGNLNEQNVDVPLRTDRGDSNEKIYTARIRSTSDPRPIKNITQLQPPSFAADPPSHCASPRCLPIHPTISSNPIAYSRDNLYNYAIESPSHVRPSFPDPHPFSGEQENDTEFLMFCEQLRAKIAFDEHLFKDGKSKVLFTMGFLGHSLRKLIAEKWDKETHSFLDIADHEDVIRIIQVYREKPREAYRILLESKRELEKTLRALKKKISGPDIVLPFALHGWNQFKERFDDNPISAIEVLIGKPKFYWQRNREDETTPLITKNSNDATESDYDFWLDRWRDGRDIPERIRINSSPLLQVLKKVAAGDWSGIDFEASLEEVGEDEVGTSLVFLRPYKFFYHFHAEIETREKVLRERLASVQSAATHQSENNAPTETTREEPPSDRSNGTDEEEAQALKHLQNLINFIHSAVLPLAGKLRLSVDDHGAPSRVCFQDLWYLFQPGDDVFISDEMPEQTQQKDAKKSSVRKSVLNKPSAWRVYNVTGGRPFLSPSENGQQTKPREPIEALLLILYKIDCTGSPSTFGPISRIIDIPHFEGEKDITALSVVPLRFSRDSSQKEQFHNLGQKFLQLTKQEYVHQQYTGPTLTRSPIGAEYVNAENAMLIHERVMVDFQDAEAENPDWAHNLFIPDLLVPDKLSVCESWPVKTWTKDGQNWTSKARSDNIYDDNHVDGSRTQKFKEEDKLFSGFVKYSEWPVTDNRVTHDHIGEDDFLLLPNRVCAFRFSRREYINIAVEGLEDFPEPSDAWDEVVFDNQGHRKILEALVKSHRARKSSRFDSSNISYPKPGQDLVAGKGEGLVILLHGKPGVGKTSTVECLSESLKFPLLQISCGTLGMEPGQIEPTLRRLFRKAERWNCLILFDEADVVLVERDRNKMIQNEICSIFLRELEYCRSIMFLTSNRAGHIDEAVKSRVHVAIYYQPLSDATKEAIWRHNLQRLKRMSNEKRKINFKNGKQEVKQMSLDFIKNNNLTEVCNGRTIRNICHVALSLAENASKSEHATIHLDWDPYFKEALETWKAFETYMTEVKGVSDSKWAREHGIRAD